MACGLYYSMVDALLHSKGKSSMKNILQTGIDKGLKFYGMDKDNYYEMTHFTRMFHLEALQQTEGRDMRSGGYVIETIEAAVWCLITTDSLKECLLKVVNMGHDTDTVAAVAGGLAGLYYGVDAISQDWLDEITKKEYVEELCEKASLLCGSKAIFYLQKKTDKKYAVIKRYCFTGERYIQYVDCIEDARVFDNRLFQMALRDKLLIEDDIEKRFI